MFCTQCGTSAGEMARFCGQCGASLYERPVQLNRSRRLTRSIPDKKIAGVCSGFGHYMDLDVTLVRIVWLAIALGTGVGFIAYVVAWIVLPRGDYSAVTTSVLPAN